jgi:hypothetical protein
MRRAVAASILALVAILVMVGAPAAALAHTEPADAKLTADGGKPTPLSSSSEVLHVTQDGDQGGWRPQSRGFI